MKRCSPAVVLTVLMLTTSVLAQSEARPPTPDEHLERGLRYYATQDYEKAIAEFKAGYQLRPDAVFLYALGQAQRMSGDCRSAALSYRSFIRSAPPPAQAELARGNLKRCEDTLGSEASEPPAPSAAPPPTTSAPPARAASTPSSVASPLAPRSASESPPRSAPFYTDVLGDVLSGVGVAALGVGVGAWFVAKGHATAANEATRWDDHDREAGAAKATLAVAITVGAIGIACGALGIARYATRPHPRR